MTPTERHIQGFWENFDSFSSGRALLRVWQARFGTQFAGLEPFLNPTTEHAGWYPCPRQPGCDCDHDVREDVEGGLVAVCVCGDGECSPVRLEPKDTVIYALDRQRFGEAVSRAVGFEPVEAPPMRADFRALEVGRYAPLQAPVFLHFPGSEAALLREVEALVTEQPGPFLLLTPTRSCFTAETDAALKRAAGASLALTTVLEPKPEGDGMEARRPSQPLSNPLSSPLSSSIAFDKGSDKGADKGLDKGSRDRPNSVAAEPDGHFRLKGTLKQLLADWAGRLAGWRENGEVLRSVHRELVAVRKSLANAPSPQAVPDEDAARQAFALVQRLDAEQIIGPPSLLTVFRLYCIEELSAGQIARKLVFSKPTILRRLELLRAQTGVDPNALRRVSTHLAKLEDDLTDSRAEHIHRKRLIYDDAGGEEE